MPEIKHLDFALDSFTANGNKYTIQKSLTITRFIEFEKLQQVIGWGVDFKTMFDKLNVLYENLNKMKFADCSVIVYNMLQGIAKNIDSRLHPALLLCTLFINRDGEDAGVWTEEGAKEKINDWTAEGLCVNDFFQLATNLVSGFIPAFSEVSQNTLEKPTRKPTTSKNST